MKISVLDHGYVELIETWGIGKDGRDLRVESDYNHNYAVDDCDWEVGIIEAARQSTQGSFRGWDQDQKLLTHLYTHNHATPFEFAGMVIEVQAPIFVLREWHRHRTQSYNEASARYAPLPDLYYLPSEQALLARAEAAKNTANKQAASTGNLDALDIEHWRKWVRTLQSECESAYQFGLKHGVPKELARIIIPVSHYSKMRDAANLRNWLAFMTLRCDTAAQWEIRQFADAVAQIVEAKFPRTFALWKAEQ